MYFIIEKTSQEDDVNNCERILSDFFYSELIKISNGKIGQIHFRNLYVPDEDFDISIIETGEMKFWEVRNFNNIPCYRV